MLMENITYQKIREKAAEKGLSMNRLAAEAKIARSVLARWRTGETTPTLRTFAKIQKALAPTQNQKETKV